VALREGAEVIAAGRDPEALAKAMRGRIAAGGSLLLFSGEAAFKIEVGTLAVAITNDAGGGQGGEVPRAGGDDPLPRVGVAEDVGEASLGLLTNSYVTGVTLFVDGGERLV
jgi:hypothetical protein